MFGAVKNILKLKPWYIGLYLVVLALLLLSSYLEYKSRYRDVLQLIQDQAAMTAAVIAQSGSGQAFLTEELKQAYIDRAIDMLTILNRVDAEKRLSRSDLDQWVNDETIMDITTYDSQGNVDGVPELASKIVVPEMEQNQTWIQHQLKPILSRKSDLIIVGVDQNQYSSADNDSLDDQFMVAIPRDRGGAIVCQLSLEAEQNFKYLTAMESALEDLLYVKGLQYLMLSLDDREPYYVSKSDQKVDNSWDRTPLADILFKVSRVDTSLLEVVRPVFFGSSLGEVRIGFEDDTLDSLHGQIIYQILIRTLLLTLLAFAILIFLISRQNAAFLESEKSRIEKEVYHLEKLNRLREKQAAMGELAAGVAHEIRNPLNAIGMVAQRLKREFDPKEDQGDYELLTGTMVAEIGRINNSLQEFLEYTRPTSLNYAPVDMAALLEQIHQLYHSQAIDRGVELFVETEALVIEADSDYLRQAISNLVKNALEASSPGQSVHISTQQSDGMLKIIVEDSGAGIAGEQLSRIFDLYYSTKDMGTGVGLALTHKIIADHNGSIEVSSELGKGSKFEIELPVRP